MLRSLPLCLDRLVGLFGDTLRLLLFVPRVLVPCLLPCFPGLVRWVYWLLVVEVVLHTFPGTLRGPRLRPVPRGGHLVPAPFPGALVFACSYWG